MQLANEFVIGADFEKTWELLNDLERVAPCLPGASITGREEDRFLGTVKVKVGPIGANLHGVARFVSTDKAAGTAVLSMAGKDPKGGTATDATMRVRLEPIHETSTRVFLDTDLEISGRMAQFGRGAIADVSNRLIGQFTDNLAALVDAGPVQAVGASSAQPLAAVGTTSAGSAVPPRPAASSDLNVMELIGPGLVKDVGRPLLFFVLGYLVARAFPRKRDL